MVQVCKNCHKVISCDIGTCGYCPIPKRICKKMNLDLLLRLQKQGGEKTEHVLTIICPSCLGFIEKKYGNITLQ